MEKTFWKLIMTAYRQGYLNGQYDNQFGDGDADYDAWLSEVQDDMAIGDVEIPGALLDKLSNE